MGEQNIGTILDSVEIVYRSYRRNGNCLLVFKVGAKLSIFYLDVTSTLTTLIIDGISSHSSLLDSYVVIYAAFVSSLHKIVGVEFGKSHLMISGSLIPELNYILYFFFFFPLAAHFVQTLVASYERHFASFQATTIPSTDTATEQDGKECSNLLVLISELYNFQVVSSILIFDVIRHLLSDDLTELKVELLLKIMRSKL